jgi:hypothetical protein
MWIHVHRRRFFFSIFTLFLDVFSVEKGIISTPHVDIVWIGGTVDIPIESSADRGAAPAC